MFTDLLPDRQQTVAIRIDGNPHVVAAEITGAADHAPFGVSRQGVA